MLKNVVQGDVCIATESSRQCWHAKSREGGKRVVRRCKCREDQVEPNHVGFYLPDCPQQTERTGQIIKCPAAHHTEPGRFLAICAQRAAVFVGSELVVIQSVSEDGQVDPRVTLHLPRYIEGVLVQLAATGRKSGN